MEIWVPPSAERRVVARCRVPGCGAVFYEGQHAAWEKHVGDCARKHIDEIRAISPTERRRGTVFDREQWDPEVEAHMKRVGQRMLKDGDFEVKPHERAGFS